MNDIDSAALPTIAELEQMLVRSEMDAEVAIPTPQFRALVRLALAGYRPALVIGPAAVDKVVCDWSMETETAMAQDDQELLVDNLCKLLGITQ